MTTLSEADLITEISTPNTYLNKNSFKRGRPHFSYPVGATNDTVIAVLDNYCITGRRTTDTLSLIPFPDYYRVNCVTIKNTDALADMKTHIDNAITQNDCVIFMLESLVSSSPGSQEWLISDFQALIDYLYIKSPQIDVVTMSEFLYGLDNPRKLVI